MGKTVTREEARAATPVALELFCNANTRISCLRHEKVCAHCKKEVQLLAHREELLQMPHLTSLSWSLPKRIRSRWNK